MKPTLGTLLSYHRPLTLNDRAAPAFLSHRAGSRFAETRPRMLVAPTGSYMVRAMSAAVLQFIDETLAGGVGSLSHRSCTIRTNGVTEYAPDGYRRFDFHDVAVRRGTPLARSIGKTIAEYRAIYAGDTRFARSAERRFEQSVSTLNRWHVRPVIVLTPVHPRFARELGPLGWTRRRVELVAYLRSLRPHLRFDLLDASEIRSFHGRPQDFYDGVHMKVANVRRLLDWVVAKAHRDLTPFG